MDELILKLSKYGFPTVKEGIVFTVFIRGKELSKFNNVNDIQSIVLEYTKDKFPFLELYINDNNFLLMILKPNNEQQ